MKHPNLLSYVSRLSPAQATVYASMSKKTSTAIIITLFLGGLGIQWFYLEKTLGGILSILFCWTFIPLLASIIFLFLAREAVEEYNFQLLDSLTDKKSP